MTDKDPLEFYQTEGAAFLAVHPRGAIFDEPGLGKTAQAIRAIENTGGGQWLIICPAGVRQVWPFQFRLWGRMGLRVVRAQNIFDVIAWKRERFEVLVVSYEQAVNWQADIADDFFDGMVVDESHYLKNPETRRAKAVIDAKGGIAAMAARCWFLSGTPIKNDPADLWVPLHVAKATELTFNAFQKRYFKQRAGTFKVSNSVRKEALPELQGLLKQMSILRTFEDVGEQLPPIRMDVLPVDGNDAEIVGYLQQYPGLSDRILKNIEESGNTLAFSDSTHISTLRALIAEAKAPGYAQLVTEELKSGTIDKLVIMAHHKKAINLIHAHLVTAGINAEMFTGDTTEKHRERIVRSFQDDENGVQVIVANMVAAGTGLTLTAAARLDMFESSWTPADNVQAVRRIRRKGQKRPTFVRFVMLEYSFDQRVAGIVARKANTIVMITERDNLQEAGPTKQHA